MNSYHFHIKKHGYRGHLVVLFSIIWPVHSGHEICHISSKWVPRQFLILHHRLENPKGHLQATEQVLSMALSEHASDKLFPFIFDLDPLAIPYLIICKFRAFLDWTGLLLLITCSMLLRKILYLSYEYHTILHFTFPIAKSQAWRNLQ